MDYRQTPAAQSFRGIRNNNPGNLGYDPAITWSGQVGSDGKLVIFSDTGYGLRALGIDLANKILKDGLTTIAQVITVYAPPVENNTGAYIAAVAGDTGLDPNAPIPTTTDMLASLMRAIINHEEGDGPSQTFVSDQDIAAGIQAMPGPLLSSFVSGPTIIDNNPESFGFVLVALILGAAWMLR
jgi:hypothetical protein